MEEGRAKWNFRSSHDVTQNIDQTSRNENVLLNFQGQREQLRCGEQFRIIYSVLAREAFELDFAANLTRFPIMMNSV